MGSNYIHPLSLEEKLQQLQRPRYLEVDNCHIAELIASAQLLMLSHLEAGIGQERSENNISKRALILFNKAGKTSGPCSTVTLLGQQGRLEFKLRELKDLYCLFKATLDSECTYEEANRLAKMQQNMSATVDQMIQQLASMQLQPGICNCETILSPYSFSLHLVPYRSTGHLVSPTGHHESSQELIVARCLDNSQAGINYTTLSAMMEAAADLLEQEGGTPLATELRKFRISCTSAHEFLSKHPSNRGACGENDKIIILCVQTLSNTVMVSKQIVGQGRTTWTVTIHHQTKGPDPLDETASDPHDSDPDNWGDETGLDFSPSPGPETGRGNGFR
ncbi:hypothetical protein P3342_012861 [Pyrenophora teres f. teres]|uniref:Uncharacterized protein n=1 Tax=Pyrenophora teres f. teres TaxID=97479 RepID=A0A6S6WFR2_9PLEO|nr:hypothetical protein PTNB85_06791 [Pyrenophora teres f. teres]KAE8856061.1 hypothetical protein PTNB29_08900 [Pyrenophora teres f. teres]KAK1911559.1 hypothetical protein P3342_012861 [Pyrenophora teres f. teres]CAE7215389.1 hypothetical protein PTTW11_10688 [Pyrenophora teres f. teres]